MSRKWKTLILSGASLIVVSCATTAILNAGASTETLLPAKQIPQPRSERRIRNLSLQPEALKASRQLGTRFAPKARGSTVATGNLIVGTNEQMITITRRQTDDGESIDLVLGGRTLTWNQTEGVRALTNSPTATERRLAEQLVLDSPDQFVLAQLRGASYFTVARNVRPTDATDGYTGPLWTLVRVDERQQNETARPLSAWRIYYINAQTGLPDRIEYQLDGQDIRAEFLEWTEQQGEKTPSRVRWSSDGTTIMEYRTTTVSHNK